VTAYIKSKTFHKSSPNRGLAVLSILIVISVFALSFLYLIQTNSLVSCSYQIRQQKEYLRELQAKNQELEMEIAQWQSPANLEEMIQSLGMVEVGQVVYLEEKAVAVKE
jgi:cell division protein FtsB